MSKIKKKAKDDVASVSKKQTKSGSEKERKDTNSKPVRQDGMRETIESVVVAFILAFLFRTFEAEAFVIPTGSMAPTLLGRHKDVTCEHCGYNFMIGASDEVNSDRGGYFNPIFRINAAICPNCRFENNIKELPVFKGDRILVNKFPYEIGEPDRFDVIVFKYPEDPKTNYIKRLVGLPGERIKIERGDVFVRKSGSGESWTIARKRDPNKQMRQQQLVYDNAYQSPVLQESGWPDRWIAVEKDDASNSLAGWSHDEDGWKSSENSANFSLTRDATADGNRRWIRYQHLIPTRKTWDSVLQGEEIAQRPKPQLITDFCGYNAYTGGRSSGIDAGFYWVGDLTLSCEVALSEIGPQAEILFELNEGIRRYRCRIDPSNGEATLLFLDDELDPQEERVLASAKTEIKGTGNYNVSFANVDDRLCLWVNGDLVEFDKPTEFHPPALPDPQEEDLIPVGIAAVDASVEVSHLLIGRDIYYRGEHVIDPNDYSHDPATIHEFSQEYVRDSRDELSRLLTSPGAWAREYRKYGRPAEFNNLGDAEFFVMGDNSPRSKDGRLWSNSRRDPNRHAVPRSALVGKAFFIYWPHGEPFLNGGQGYPIMYHKSGPGQTAKPKYPSFRVPFYPHVSRMQRIR